MLGLAGKQASVGLDIDKSCITGVQIAGKYPNTVLKACHERPLPEGLVYEGEILDPDGLGQELRAFLKESGIKGKLAYLGVGNQKVIVRTIEVPEMDEEELRGAIEFQAQDYVPIPVDEAILDFQVVSKTTDAEGDTKQQVLLVAAQKDMIQRFMDSARRAGLKVGGIDVSAFALVRALTPQLSFLDQDPDRKAALAVLNISSSVSTMVISEEGVPKFTRVFNLAYDSLTQALADQEGVTRDDAMALAERIGLPGPLEPDRESYTDTTIEEVQGILASAADGLADEIHRSLEYYSGQDYSGPVEQILLAGRGAMLRNLASYLSDTLNLKVEVSNPLLKVGRNDSGVPDDVLSAIAPRLAVAVGLAMDEVE